MSNKKKKRKKKVRLKKWVKVTILISIVLLILTSIIYIVCSNLSNKKEGKIETVTKEELELDNYKYYINSNASDYEKEAFEELKKVLSKE